MIEKSILFGSFLLCFSCSEDKGMQSNEEHVRLIGEESFNMPSFQVISETQKYGDYTPGAHNMRVNYTENKLRYVVLVKGILSISKLAKNADPDSKVVLTEPLATDSVEMIEEDEKFMKLHSVISWKGASSKRMSNDWVYDKVKNQVFQLKKQYLPTGNDTEVKYESIVYIGER